MGNLGACNACAPQVPMSLADEARWTCSGPDIALAQYSNPNSKTCMSWTTQDTCAWRQKDLTALQVHLKSSGCNGVWAAPLWMTPDSWHAPQEATGELDIFERGCSSKDGYLTSFGSRDPFIVYDSWGQQNKPDDPSDFVAYMEFDVSKDTVSMRRCDPGSNPIANRDFSKCSAPVVHSGYFAETAGQTQGNTEYMHFVSDIWNKCPALNCGHATKPDSQCSFSLSGLQMKFSEVATAGGKSPFRNGNPVCAPLIASGKSYAEVGDLCGSDSPDQKACDPQFQGIACGKAPDGQSRCICSDSYKACGPSKVCSP